MNDADTLRIAKNVRDTLALEPHAVAARHARDTMLCRLWAAVFGCTMEEACAELERTKAEELEIYRLAVGDRDPQLAKKLFPQPADESQLPDVPPTS